MPAPGDSGKASARLTADGVIIAVHLTPKAGADEVVGVEVRGGQRALKARVRAAPESGKANAALVKLIADWLDEPKSKCEIVSGGKSRLKQVLVRGDAAVLLDRLAARLKSLAPGE
jgi:uncharacterized protein (TIGR00251 family)